MRGFAWILALAVALTASCGPRRPQPMTAFDGRLADWSREILADSPELASAAGVSEEAAGGPYGARLDDRSPLAAEARRSAAIRRYTELRALDREALGERQQLTYAILASQFEAASDAAAFDYGDFSPLGGARPYVLNQLDSAFLTLPSFLDERHPIATLTDAENYVARLRLVADAIDAETERARADAQRGVRPPLYIIDLTLTQLDQIIAQPAMQQIYITSLQRKLAAL
ncbi:MAG: DUF885 family protein, partial [Hyphomonadaceae bacterium]|nr:DUF885 family protein [Hyphomonadaceae bacterium]